MYRSLWYIWVFGFWARRKSRWRIPAPVRLPNCVWPEQPGDVGLRNMVNAASSHGQEQWPCFIKTNCRQTPFGVRSWGIDSGLNGRFDRYQHL